MSAKKQSTKGGQTAAQNKGKAIGYGKKFEGDFADATPIRALGPIFSSWTRAWGEAVSTVRSP